MSNREQIDQRDFWSTQKMMSQNTEKWMEAYLQAALEVDRQKMVWRIDTAREAVAERLKDLEEDADHHAERNEMQSALWALTGIEDETRSWPTMASALTATALLSKWKN